jgi:leucyl-tRNA synthetase
VRSRLKLARGTPQAVAVEAALADPAVRKFTDGQQPKQVVFVPDRLVNLVV